MEVYLKHANNPRGRVLQGPVDENSLNQIGRLLAGCKKLLQAVVFAKGGITHRYKYLDPTFPIDCCLREKSMTEPDLQYWGSIQFWKNKAL